MSSSRSPRIGFIGLGTMGAPMATNLLKAGFSLSVWNRTTAKMEALRRHGAKSCSSAAAAAAESEMIVTMLGRSQDVEHVVLGPEGVCEGIRPGSVLIDMSTVSPTTSRTLAGAVTAKRAEFLDAPVVGSKGPATDGTLVMLVGGLPQTLERCQSLLKAMGKTIIHAGNVGAGATLKLATNLMLAHLMAGFSEALLLAKQAGLDPSLLIRVIEASTFHSPWYRMKGSGMLQADFSTHFALKHMRKDLELMSLLARELSLALPVTETVRALFADAERAGRAEFDYSAVFAHLAAASSPHNHVEADASR